MLLKYFIKALNPVVKEYEKFRGWFMDSFEKSCEWFGNGLVDGLRIVREWFMDSFLNGS